MFFCSVLGEGKAYSVDMDERHVAQQEGMMSHEEIIQRFKNLFGREMTAAERQSFFLDLLMTVSKA